MPLPRFTASIAIAAVLTLGVSTLAQAQPYGGPRHHGPPPHAHGHSPQHGHHPGWQHGPRPKPHMHHHGPRSAPQMHYGHRPPPPPMARHYRGAGPHHNLVRGSYLPPQYRAPRYVVHDWRGHRLQRPPRGHHWVHYGGDYLLVAAASGVITQLIIHGMR